MSKTVVVIAESSAELRVEGAQLRAAAADVSSLENALGELGLEMRPLFGESEDRLLARMAASSSSEGRPDEEALERFYGVEVADDDAEAVAERLAGMPAIAGAYVQPAPVLAATVKESRAPRSLSEAEPGVEAINAHAPAPEPAPPATPNFIARQIYRNAAPAGIDVAAAWSRAGGRGAGIRVIDCEGAWRFTHEDLLQNQGGVIGPQTDDLGWRNHGTAVVSVIGGDDNAFGVLGIAPDAHVRGSSIFGPGGLPAAIRAAADALGAGDIILIEVQYGHPVRGFTSVEWWPADYAAIRYAVGRGVIVVEAAGNGNNNLDDPIYDTPLAGFPGDWSNAFRRGARDSGAVLVGAGAPPPGVHGANWGPDRSRLDFSNYGAAVDVQGWGREVTSAGYGDLQGGGNEDLWYSDRFSGTSSASPIVVGTLACIQGALRGAGRPLLTPATARSVLRSTGSPQTDAPGRPATQRIGNRPNLRALIDRLLPGKVRPVALYRYWNAGATDHFYTTNWSELGGGAHGWAYEGVQAYIFPSQVPGTVPLHRYWNAGIADHFYTTNWGELGSGAHGWAYEGVQGYVRPAADVGTVPLYRYWGNTDHFYTTNWNELGSGRYGWRYEGIACHVYPNAAGASADESAEKPSRSLQELFALSPDATQEPAREGSEPLVAAASSFAEKATGTVESSSASPLPFEEKARGFSAGASSQPQTNWSAVAPAAGGQGGRSLTININLAGSD